MRKLIFVLWMVVCGCGSGFSQRLVSGDSVGFKFAPALRDQKEISTILLQTSDSTAFLSWMKKRQPQWIIKKLNDNLYLVSELRKNSLELFKNAPGIKFIDRGDRIAKEETLLGDFDLSLNTVTTARSVFPSITGEGLVLSIKEKPFDREDIDLRGRIIINSQFDEPSTLHATLIATIAAGAGNSAPNAKGVAWKSSITTSDFATLLPDSGPELAVQGISVQNHAYGVGIENYYGIETKEYDLFCNQFPKILHVFSSGNEGSETTTEGMYAGIPAVANLTGQFKVSKNTISVGSSDLYGNVVPRSSRGPAYDGRIKPELVAYGDAGSSEAASVVSGVALLIQQSYENIYGELPDAALVKAVLINSSIDSGRPHVDYETGFGSVNALGAIRTIESGNIISGSITRNEEVVFPLNIPSGKHLVKLTLTWNDPAAEPFTTKGLIHDLDLSVHNVETGGQWDPWVLNSQPDQEALMQLAVRGKDRLNNIEQVTLDSPLGGNYEVKVIGQSLTGSQKFFIAYEVISGFEWIFPVEKNALSSGKTNILRWQSNNSNAVGKLEYRYWNENWITISQAVDLSKMYYEWETPDTANLMQLRMTIGQDVLESSVFPVSIPNRLKVGYNCETEIMLLWNSVENADGYVLYTLGERYLEPLLITNDTFAIVQKSQIATNYFAINPKFGEREGLREFTINYNSQGTACYFVNFLPRQYFVKEEAIFDVMLGTIYKLQSAILERLNNGNFKAVQTIDPLFVDEFSFKDSDPLSGLNTYRVRLMTDDGVSIFSDEAEIFYVRENDMFLFPNPVSSGENLNIVVMDEDLAEISLFSSTGKYIGYTEDFGNVKVMMTTNLPRGSYLVQVTTKEGRVLMKKLIVI